MTKLFTSQQFVDKFKWLVNDVPNEYYSGSQWLTYDKSTGKWRMDCVLSVKGILWGFSADKNKAKGGAVYKSNGVPDFTCNGALDYCTGVSTDFSKLVAGEYLCMKGVKDSDGKALNHTGIYLGNGKVFECTSSRAWGVSKCVISDIDSKGIRSRNGIKNYRWGYHGKLQWVDYENSQDLDKVANQVVDIINTSKLSYKDVLKRVNEIFESKDKKYIQLTDDVWCRTNGIGFNNPKYKIIPKGTKCELIAKNVGKANGYNWDKIIYDGKTVYLPNKWVKYL